MQNSTKLEIFNTFKDSYTPSSYLGLTGKLSERKELRYDQIPMVNGICPICKSNQDEDESHFLIYCSKYSILRNEFYKKR